MKKMRIHELAKLLNVSNAEIVGILISLTINKSSPLSALTEEEVQAVIAYLNDTDIGNTDNENIQSIPRLKFNINDLRPSIIDETVKPFNADSLINENVSKEITSEVKEHIQTAFAKIQTIDDLVVLLNKVNKKLYGKNQHNIKKKHLTYYAFHAKDKFKRFEIPKKSGGIREIYSPKKSLKYILRTLNYIFQAIHKPLLTSHGFLPNRSVVTNAKVHVNKNYVFNTDIENFFLNIHQARIWKRLQHPPFNLGGEKIGLANVIANLTCIQFESDSAQKNCLAQGAPTSPILSNIICHRLDKKLFTLAKEYNLKYTRYADDITFSSDHNVYQAESVFLQKLFSIIRSENFNINPKKTRLQKRSYKQEVTGMIVNEKVNVSRKYIKSLRALIHIAEKYGVAKSQVIFANRNNGKSLEQVIQGKLQYLKMVKGINDSTYMTIAQKYMNAYKKISIETNDVKTSKEPMTKIVKRSDINDRHNPKELVDILKNFTTCSNPPCALKAAVHSEEVYYEFNGYDNYMKQLKKEWKEINEPLKKLSPRLHAKVYAFLFAKDLGTENRAKKYRGNSGWGDYMITFGWSSPELKEWCQSTVHNPKGNNPFNYQLPDKDVKEVNDKTISTFKDICMDVFKYEIEVRTDLKQLYKIFQQIKKELGSEYKFSIDEQLQNLEFYSDVHWLKGGINTIFAEVRSRGSKKIDVNLRDDNDDFIELEIIHYESNVFKDSKRLASEVNDGGFGTIAERFCSLCDWSVEAQCSDGNYKINFLRPKNGQEIEKIEYEPKGFTHILRFYK